MQITSPESSFTVTASVKAWLPSAYSIHEFTSALEAGKAARMLHFTNSDMTASGWLAVGESAVTLVVAPRDELAAQAVLQLRAKLDQVRAEFTKRQQEILDQISNLQAIEYTEAA